MSKRRGKFIVIDGGEGAGTTTIAECMAKKFNGFSTREPGGTEFGEDIRKIALHKEYSGKLDPFTLLCLMFAARKEHMMKVVMPALARGIDVFCDRFDSSTFAYQVPENERLGELFFVMRNLTIEIEMWKPDLYIILDVPPQVGLARVAERGGKKDHFEKRNLQFHNRVREGYRRFADAIPERCVIVDAALPLKAVKEEVSLLIKGVLSQR